MSNDLDKFKQEQGYKVQETVLSCHALHKHYSQGSTQINVLQNIDLKLSKGERLAIIGTSGSGKSTLLNMLGGLDQPSSGKVELLGNTFSDFNADKRARLRNAELGFVYQFHHLLPEFSAQENVAIPLLIAGKKFSYAQQCAADMLTLVGLKHRLQHKPSELSGGERQRVAIARSLICKPSCVLMDEPTGNLDRHTASTIQDLLLTLNQELETSFIIVTHDEHVAETMDRILLLEDGDLKKPTTQGQV
jgi:lipoprotein-releasing system ATP-binding protein